MSFIPGQTTPVREINDEQFAEEQRRLAEEAQRPAPSLPTFVEGPAETPIDVPAEATVAATNITEWPRSPEPPDVQAVPDPDPQVQVSPSAWRVQVGDAVVDVIRTSSGQFKLSSPNAQGGITYPPNKYDETMIAAAAWATSLNRALRLEEEAGVIREQANAALQTAHAEMMR